jgi:hypothetical protein
MGETTTAGAPERTEAQMRDEKVPTFKSVEEMAEYVRALVEGEHDYGTCVHAMSMAATAAFNFVAGQLGVTGFQASCAELDVLRRTRGWEWGRILDYSELLYPQYVDEDHFPSARKVIRDNAAEFAKRARARLAEGRDAHPRVVAHWEWLASLAPEEKAAEEQAPGTPA